MKIFSKLKLIFTPTDDDDAVNKKYVDGTLNAALTEYEPNIQQMIGATKEKDGNSGIVPAPLAADKDRFLKGDGTWADINLEGKADNLFFDEEKNELQLKSGDNMLSSITIKNIGNGGNTGGNEPGDFKIVTWTHGTDQEIEAMLNAHYSGKIDISDYWSIGDSRVVDLAATTGLVDGVTNDAQQIELIIVDFKHDDLFDGSGKAAVTVQQKDCLISGDSMAGNVGWNSCGWNNSPRRTWCNNMYKSALPATLNGLIKPVSKITSAGNMKSDLVTTKDYIFIPSEIEVFGSIKNSVDGEGYLYKYYETSANLEKYYGIRHSNKANWFTRSPNIHSTTDFCVYCYSLNDKQDILNSSSKVGIAPAFCI